MLAAPGGSQGFQDFATQLTCTLAPIDDP